MKTILKIGLIIASINILIGLIIKFFLPLETMFSGKYMLFSTVIALVLLVIVGRKFLRTDDHPDLNYGEALKYLFPAYFLAYTISIIFSIVLYQNDDAMKKALLDYNISAQETAFNFAGQLTGADEAELERAKEEAIDKIESNADEDYLFQFSKLPVNLFTGLIMSLINALIASIFVKYKSIKP